MAYSDPLSFSYNGASVTMNRINQDNYGAVYYGEATDRKLTLTVKHTIPSRGQAGESHMVRLDVEQYAAGEYVRTTSAWSVIRTDDATQDLEEAEDAMEAIVDFLSDANVTKLATRQS